MEQRVVFEHVIEGIVKAFGPRLTPAIRARWAEIGIKLDGKLQPAYPIAQWIAGLDVLRQSFCAELSVDEGFYRLGRQYMDGYFATRMGSALGALMKVIGPERVMGRLTAQFRSANNFAQVTVRELGRRDFEIDMNGGGHVQFTRGLISRAMENAGAHDFRIDVLHGDEHRYLYRASWT